ncbi:MAG: carboxypeptidase-like regulatory domain-containing protein [Bacteroidia bacterium]|nr:carboxypeptidase-like regulatory domain-containing protein [Bacteroidia bacterium]
MSNDNSSFKNGLLGAFIGAFITGSISFIVTFYQENSKIELERKQYESTLIIEAIVKNNPVQSRKNIQFLIESRLISPDNEKIISLLTDTAFKIILVPIDTIEIKPHNPQVLNFSTLIADLRSAQIVDENDKPIKNAEVLVNPCYNEFRKEFTNCFSSTFTDSNGLFEIILPNKNEYRFVIQKKGFEMINMTCIKNKRWHYQNKIKIKKGRA